MKSYPYLCDTRGCSSKRKSIPRAKIEDGFAELIKTIQPSKQVFTIACMMFEDAWNAQLQIATQSAEEVRRQLKVVEQKIENLLDRIVETASPSVVRTYETRLTKLEREKIVLGEKHPQRCRKRDGWRNLSNYRSNSCQTFGLFIKMATTPPAKQCFVWPSSSLFGIAGMKVVELPNFRVLSRC